MSIWEYSVKKPVFAWMLMAAFLFFGIIGYNRLGISQNPDIDFPVVNVSVGWEGAAPEVLELDVADTIEGQISTISNVKNINTTARRGQVNISVEFELGKDIDLAVQEVQSKLLQAQRNLPKDIDSPIITKVNPEDRPIMWLSVTSDKLSSRELMIYVRDRIKDKFQTIEGVSDIILGGYIEPNLRIWPSLKSLEKFELSTLDIVSAVQTEQKELPSGSLKQNNEDLILRVMGETDNINDFGKIAINRRGGSPNFNPLMLRDVAELEDGIAEVQRISRVNGKSSVGLGIRKQRGANAVKVGELVKEKLIAVQKILPPELEMGLNFDSTQFIEESMNELKFTILISVLMTSLVVWFFLGSFSATFNIIQSIPTVLFATFFAMNYLGFTLNNFTMLALTLAVGMIVDDNIMVLENINRWHTQTKDWVVASIKGTDEIVAAVIATSVAVVAIFLPIGYMQGIIGQFFYQFAITMTLAIFFSTIDALVFTPMRASQTGSKKTPRVAPGEKMMKHLEIFYIKTLAWSLNRPIKTLLVSLVILIPTLYSAKFVTKEFVPAQDQSTLMVLIKTKPGSTIEFTDQKSKEIEKILLTTPQISRYFISIGGFSGNEANSAFVYVTLLPVKERPDLNGKKHPSHLDIAEYLRNVFKEKVPGPFIMVQDPSTQGFSQGRGQGANVEFKITGAEWPMLTALVDKSKKILEDSKSIDDVDSNFKGHVTEMRIIPIREKAQERGVSVEDIAKTLQASVSGLVISKMSSGGRRFDVRIKLRDSELQNIDIIKNLSIRNNRGQLVPLGEICKIEKVPGLLSTTRQNRERAVNVFGQSKPKLSLDKIIADIKIQLDKIMPAGYTVEVSGASQDFKNSMKNFIMIFLMGIMISYMVLGAQFNSFRDPLTILLALPFSIAGAFISLLLTGFSLNLYSMIGLILLAGIVKKNSIMLVEFTNQVREKENLSIFDSLLKACPLRLRPIVMTSLTTIAGTLPAALALGPGAETRVPLAIAVIGGLLFSTVLTLYVVPSFYATFYSRKIKS